MLRNLIPALALAVTPLLVSAQAAAPALAVANVPTTKILAIGTVTAPAGGTAAMNSIMPNEVADTVRLFLAGKIDQWYSRKDVRGVVFVMNVTTTEEAHTLLEKLPLGVAGILKFDLIPMGPLGPLTYILPPATTAASK